MLRQGQSKKFLKEVIIKYYGLRILKEPHFLPKREIAIQPIDSKTYVRHLQFPSMIKLYEYINDNPPLHLYYSVALYENPSSRDMESKGLIRADLMFDIDADHYSGCRDLVSICLSCGEVFKDDIKECPKCRSKEISKIPQLSEQCLRRAWGDALILIDILENELGAEKITVSFSGNRGFHIRVEDEHLTILDRDSRREIVDYITLSNIMIDRLVPRIGRKKDKAIFFKEHEHGIRARLRDYALQYLDVIDHGHYIEVSYNDLLKLADLMRIDIDTVVTMDTSRLSRFIYSINGKSGLAVYELDPNRDFDYTFSDFRILDGTVTIKPYFTIPQIRILDKEHRLHSGEPIRVDAYIGFYLAIKGLVEVVNTDNLEVRRP